jgi:LysR family glycine cleavage system transcriptional activator
MPKSLPPLTSLRTFEVAARLGSFTKAARELHVTPAAVSHQIRGLEEYLGVTLFRRTTRRLVLTEQAATAAEYLREGFERISRGAELLRPSSKGGTLSLSATPAFATRWLVSRLSRFQKQHPRFELHVKASAAPLDFDQDDVDAAIRLGKGGFEGVLAVELFNEWIAPVASPAFLRQHTLRRPADLARLPLLHDDSMRRAGRPQGWPAWFRAAGVTDAGAWQGTHFDDGHLALQAAAAGSGVAVGRLVYAMDDLAAKRLKIAFRPAIKMDISYYLLIPESRAALPSVVAFRSWIKAEAVAFSRSLDAMLGSRSGWVAAGRTAPAGRSSIVQRKR